MTKLPKKSDTSLFFRSRGTGRSILFLHGFTADHRLMAGCFEPLFKTHRGWRRIYVDLPGMGRSSSRGITNADQMLARLVEFIGQEIPRGPFAVAGESYGGYLAQGLVGALPERVSGLALICPVVIPDPKRRELPAFEVRQRDDAFLHKLRSEAKAEFESMTSVQTKSTWRAFEKDILPGLKLHDKKFCTKYFAEGYGFKNSPAIPPTPKPTLILTGRQDSVVGYADAYALSNQYPHATFAAADGAGHNLQLERPKLFRALAEDWLSRLSDFK